MTEMSMRHTVAAGVLASLLGAVPAASTAWASFGDSGGSGACTAAASTTKGPGLGCDYSSCTDRGAPRGIKHLDEGETTYEIGSFNKLVCRGGKLVKALY
jgi:hypothetical protein